MSKAEGYVTLDEDVERAAKGGAPVSPPHSPRPSVAKAHRGFGLPLPLPTLPGESPVLSDAAEAFAADAAQKSPMLDGGDLPLKFLAQGLSMLSIDELRRLRLPAMPWQAGDGGPSMWEGIKKTPWKAHYSNMLGFVISTGACTAPGRSSARRALTAARRRSAHRARVGVAGRQPAGGVRLAGADATRAQRPRSCGAASPARPAATCPGAGNAADCESSAHCACRRPGVRLTRARPLTTVPGTGLRAPREARLPHERDDEQPDVPGTHPPAARRSSAFLAASELTRSRNGSNPPSLPPLPGPPGGHLQLAVAGRQPAG